MAHLRKKKLKRAQATQKTRETRDPTINETACYDFTGKLTVTLFGRIIHTSWHAFNNLFYLGIRLKKASVFYLRSGRIISYKDNLVRRVSPSKDCQNRLIGILIVIILWFLLWSDKYISQVTNFVCACSACLRVSFWLIVCKNSRAEKLWRFVPVSRIKALKLQPSEFPFLTWRPTWGSEVH